MNLKEYLIRTNILRNYGPAVLFIFGIILLFLHSFRPSLVNIDIWTILLIAVLIVIPFSSDIWEIILSPEKGVQIRKTTTEFREQVASSREDAIENLRKRVNELEEEDQEEVEEDLHQDISRLRTKINQLTQEAHYQAAFMEVMRHIERELRNLLLAEGIDEIERASLGQMTRAARQYNVLSKSLIMNLEDIRPLRNQVAHGQKVSVDEIQSMIDLGLDLYEALVYEREASDITENTIINSIRNNPNIVEDGFEIIESEVSTDLGRIDMLGEDSEGNKVIVEIKSTEVDETHLKQLIGFLQSQRDELGEDVRGILVAPSVSTELESLTDDKIKVKQINPENL